VIARLRARHRRVAFALPLLAPILLWVVAQRPAAPVMDALPAALLGHPPTADVDWWSLPGEPRLELGVERGSGRRALRATGPLRQPDVLVYWLPDPPGSGEGVPEGAILVGRLEGEGPLAFPPPGPSGSLLLFSLGHQERVAWIPLERPTP